VRSLSLVVFAVLAALAAGQQLSRDGAIVRGSVDKKVIALVFTGHEFAEGGETILHALAARHARASFFLTGDFLRRPEFAPLVRRIVADGHYLGPHSDRHLLYCDWSEQKKTLVTRDQFRADLEANLREIGRFGVPAPRVRYFLPAYEWCNAEFVPSEEIVASILRAEASDAHGLNGFLLLLHVGAGPRRTDKLHTRFAALLDTLAGKGYQFVRVDELLAPPPTRN
jgi:peptidoglycan/xylan/chitin deacetylase (PgdA/CDA1 family)